MRDIVKSAVGFKRLLEWQRKQRNQEQKKDPGGQRPNASSPDIHTPSIAVCAFYKSFTSPLHLEPCCTDILRIHVCHGFETHITT